jgi:16S rRNA (guanine527-N7)-methyltransferase
MQNLHPLFLMRSLDVGRPYFNRIVPEVMIPEDKDVTFTGMNRPWHAGRMASPQLPVDLQRPLARYLDLLDRWNRTHALTALPPGARREELLLDAAALLPFLASLPAGARVADLGTGMGSPAVVLALARPDITVLGVDASAKKLAFVRQVSLELPVPNLQPLHGRLEQLPPLGADLGVAKALGSLGQLAAWWSRHGRPGAPFLALKGPEGEREPLPEGWIAEAHPYELPTRGKRVVVVLRRA